MLLTHGDISKLKGKSWYMCEIRSEKTGESTIKRIGKAIPGIFRNEPVELFVPVMHRDLDVFELRTACYVFCRSTNFATLNRLRTITGVVQIVTEGESNRASKALQWPDADVQVIIKEAEDAFVKRALGVVPGGFVRILDGPLRDYCGHVDAINDGVACVRIDMKTRCVVVETPIRNLVDLNHVPVNQRVFYYGPLIAEMVKELGEEGLKLLAEDLFFNPNESNISKLDELPIEPEEKTDTILPRRHSRQNTVTALVKKLIFEKTVDPLDIAKKVVEAIKANTVKPPKNLFIVYCVVKNSLMRFHFKQDPELVTYRDVIRKHGKTFKFSAKDIAKLDTAGTVPIRTIDVCKDGRSREARLKKKKRESQQIPLSISIRDHVLSINGNKPKDNDSKILTSAKWLRVK